MTEVLVPPELARARLSAAEAAMFGGFLLEHGLAVEVRPNVFELVGQHADDTTATHTPRAADGAVEVIATA